MNQMTSQSYFLISGALTTELNDLAGATFPNSDDQEATRGIRIAEVEQALRELDALYTTHAPQEAPKQRMSYALVSKALNKTLDGVLTKSQRTILRIMSDGNRHTRAELDAKSGNRESTRRLREVKTILRKYGFHIAYARAGKAQTYRLMKLRPKQEELPKLVQLQDTKGHA